MPGTARYVELSTERECLVIAGVRGLAQCGEGTPVGGLVATLGIRGRRIVTGGDGAHVVADGR
jgi:hypothetical protein